MNTQAFLASTTPFNLLPPEVCNGLVEKLDYINFTQTETLYQQHKTAVSGLDIIISGKFDTFFYDPNGKKKLLVSLNQHDTYGAFSILLNNGKSIHTVAVNKNTAIFRLPTNIFRELCENYQDFYNYFLTAFGKEMLNEAYAHFVINRPLEVEMTGLDRYFSRRVDSVSMRPIMRCSPQTPIYQVAEMMDYNKIGCLFIEENGALKGYVTDITMRNRVVAAQRHSHEPVVNIMEWEIFTLSNEAYIYEAILLMFRHKIRYLVIEENGVPMGVISRNKLLTDQAESPFVFIQSVRLANSVDELKLRWNEVPEVVYNLLTRGVRSELVNQVITHVSDSIAQKVIELRIYQMGEPPAEFVFMALGSEGRKEQTLKTDQDNAIIYEDKANEFRDKTRAYFLELAEKVSEDLNHIGFSFCTGGLMAKNPKWTHSLSHWKNNYNEWIGNPNPEAVMNFSTFFDCRIIYGQPKLIEELKDHIVEKLESANQYFFVQLASNALQYEPPLTFFKGIRTIAKGDQQVFNIKHAMTPIVDLVRVYALKHQIIRTNTGDRLLYLKNQGIFSLEDYHELMQAYYYLMGLRLKNQAKQILQERTEADNFINPTTLTKIEKVTLTQIFKVIESFQQRIKILFMRKIY